MCLVIKLFIYSLCITDGNSIEARFDDLDRQIEAAVRQIDVLTRATARGFRDLQHFIDYRVGRVNEGLQGLDCEMEAFGGHMDSEVEEQL